MSLTNKIVVGLVGLTVMAVVFSAMLPIMGEVTSAEDTFMNEGYFTYDAVNNDTDVTIIWDPTDPEKLSMGDKVLDMSVIMPSNGNLTIIGSDSFSCRYYKNNTSNGVQTYGVGGFKAYNTVNEVAPVTITVSNTELAFDGAVDKTYTMGNRGFVINFNGDGALSLKYPTETAYVKDDSDIYLCGTTFVTGSGTNDWVGVFGYGSIDDGITLSCFYGNTNDNVVSFGDPTINYVADTNYIDLYKISSVDFELIQNSASVDATYSYFVVPTEVTAEKAIHPDGPTTAILNMLPIIIGAGLLLGAIAFMIVKRK